MVELTDKEYEAANARGRELFVSEPHAKTVRYDARSDMIVVDLYNGCTFSFPPRILQGLEEATEAQIAEVELASSGFGLHWESLDADFTVRGLMAGRFGNDAFMAHHRERMTAILDELDGNRRTAAA